MKKNKLNIIKSEHGLTVYGQLPQAEITNPNEIIKFLKDQKTRSSK